ncbi:hypothetical protein GSI_12659 [Ganoderma sinense ZZ0214-1]|uniref:Uncharacterized protein n=1 Tax=Ganoderma sinense ZZ0214-1 TaxID=1077348 RepID=A0A2G8RTF5_9APHY|nr:hypothetical protein GSI_12659 [Ganoderma sinense ZZ0214-1]
MLSLPQPPPTGIRNQDTTSLSDPTYHQLFSVIRMAHKYQCEALLELCVAYLKRFYHDSFDGWRDNSTCMSPPRFERIHAIGVVNLARLLGHPKMLPSVLMACCLLDAEIADGFAREDGTPPRGERQGDAPHPAPRDGTVLYSFHWDWTWTAYVEWADTRRELCPRCFEMLGKGGRQKDQHLEIFGRLPDMMGIKVDHWGKTAEEIEALTATQTDGEADG